MESTSHFDQLTPNAHLVWISQEDKNCAFSCLKLNTLFHLVWFISRFSQEPSLQTMPRWVFPCNLCTNQFLSHEDAQSHHSCSHGSHLNPICGLCPKNASHCAPKHCLFTGLSDELWTLFNTFLTEETLMQVFLKMAATGQRKFDHLNGVIVLKPTGKSQWKKNKKTNEIYQQILGGIRILAVRDGTNAFGIQRIRLTGQIFDEKVKVDRDNYEAALKELRDDSDEPRAAGYFTGKPCDPKTGFKPPGQQNQAAMIGV